MLKSRFALLIVFLVAARYPSACASEPKDATIPLASGWSSSKLSPARTSFEISGTGNRNNPLRRQLQIPFTGRELFVRFRLRYEARSIDTPEESDGEFFVLWMDEAEGSDTAAHHGGVPNLGLHVADGQNRFMVRFASTQEEFAPTTLEGDREYYIVGRLRRTKQSASAPLDALDLWIDPALHEQPSPHASVTTAKSIKSVSWLGFATGRKTEPADRIFVSDLQVATTWRSILGLPPATRRPKPTDPPASQTVVRTVSFARDVHPILKQHCFACHAGPEPEAELRLDVWDEVLNHLTPGAADKSRLIELVTSSDLKQRMPPAADGLRGLSKREILTLRAWIDEGVPWDEKLLPTPTPQSDHWALQPIRRPAIPEVARSGWVHSPIDAFVARRHEQLQLTPAPAADDTTIARRMSLDVTGLPNAFPESIRPDGGQSPAMLDRYAEQLLESPLYGEHWGRYWLDVARWAESNGHQHNRDRTNAWLYRDYVIRSFNLDKPFDQFVREQIAGDLLAVNASGSAGPKQAGQDDQDGRNDQDDWLIATGFLAAARYSGNELDKQIQRNDILVDVTNTTAKAMLGITLECAQCHTHKFDPISIRDYYRFQACFADGQPGNVVLGARDNSAKQLVEAHWDLFDSVHYRMVEDRRKRGFPEPILVIPNSVRGGMSGRERELFMRLESDLAALPQAWSWCSGAAVRHEMAIAPHQMRWPLPHVTAADADRKTFLLVRGDVKSPGPQVKPGWPAVFGPTQGSSKHPRLDLADWIAAPQNPLTARVWVNRIWQGHFGRGLVATSGDFGTQGTPPSHPELLDWLASELIDNGWSTKHIHRLILTSSTYRQGSSFNPEAHQRDSDNVMLWRWKPRRLGAEAIRDSMLMVAGSLDLALGGPSVPLSKIDSSVRRTVYLQRKRDKLPDALTLFDSPDAVTSCAARRVSTVALQPLFLLNSQFMQTTARDVARRARNVSASEPEQVASAIRIVLAREPKPQELVKAQQFTKENSLESLCLALLNLNEFLYVP